MQCSEAVSVTVALNKVVYKLVKVATSHCIGCVNANVHGVEEEEQAAAAATQFLRSSRGDDDDTVGTAHTLVVAYWIFAYLDRNSHLA